QIDKKDPSRPVLRVELRSFNLKDDDLKNLRPHLQKSPLPVALSLSGASGITDAGLAHLKDLTTLVSLGLGDVKYTDAGLKNLSGLTNLEELYLSGDQLTDASLAPLAKLTKLRKLSVYGDKLTAAAYAHLADLAQLEEVTVGGFRVEVGDECLAHM